jgi:hypothetical protein
LLPQRASDGERVSELALHYGIDFFSDRACVLIKNLGRDCCQGIPIVPFAYRVLCYGELVKKPGLRRSHQIQKVTQLLYLQAEGMQIAGVWLWPV